MALTEQQLLALISSKIYTNVANEVSGDDVADVANAIVEAIFASQTGGFERNTERLTEADLDSVTKELDLTQPPFNTANYFIIGDFEDSSSGNFNISLKTWGGGTLIYKGYFFIINEYPNKVITIDHDGNCIVPNSAILQLAQGDWAYCLGGTEINTQDYVTRVISSNKNFFTT